ncbi:phosphate/phosphite/phosphonate ABC transporter substrate-binding protein [Janthinobacterium sp. 17J80-10]|uniref:phosphate/phosphite/phosphonate ABC transporter substrate-binding protein n=1 Tax=Janthinobacterium sp. 17J80-10 TaxID=2497863 RepID=UPI0010056F7E|nr:phosphate/phosphite/phosphonate ABC transporter substrate-binding protein [Janthinobacterium sp. 17J80-10]QAU34465.1 phosphate/phosphite/phosphonate ABC transporter substrate-binding protein [Janthinobacterium sp. 17J80-10]
MNKFPASLSPGWGRWLSQLLLAVSLLASSTHALAGQCEKPQRLRFSIVPQDDLDKDIEAMRPLFDALQSATGLPVDVVKTSSYGAVVEGLLAGAIDLANLGPAAYISARRADARIVAFASTAKKTGAFQEEGAFYNALLVVRQKSAFTSLDSLRGKRLALVDPDSASGAQIPRQAFSVRVNAPLERYFGQIGYTGSHDRAALALLAGQVDAAFISSSLLSSLVERGEADASDFRVLWRSGAIPRNPFVYRDQLCSAIKEKIRAVFLGKEGRSRQILLGRIKAVRFVPIADADYQILRDLP